MSPDQVLSVSVTNDGGRLAVDVAIPPGDLDPTMMAEACWSVSTKMSLLIAHYGQLAAIRVPKDPEL